jgi:hypothetical protein
MFPTRDLGISASAEEPQIMRTTDLEGFLSFSDAIAK